MASALEKVSDYITEARVLLQDAVSPYRYDDDSLCRALNLSLQETLRVRPDLFVFNRSDDPQYFTSAESTAKVYIEQPFRHAVLNGLVGYAIQRDQEDVEDDRAKMFLNEMRFLLTGKRPGRPTAATVAAAPSSD